MIDFSDILPTFADLGGADLPKKYKYDGKSFKDLLIGKKNNSDRSWILTMGSHPAKIIDGKVNNVHIFRDRALRDKRYKVFIDTLKKISHVYDLKNDKYEINNLIYSKSEEVRKVLDKFKVIIESLPPRDAQPKYSKLTNSKYDIYPEQLNRQAEKRRDVSNHSPSLN